MTYLILLTLTLRFIKSKNVMFLHPNTYLLILTLLYVSIPVENFYLLQENLPFTFKKSTMSLVSLVTFWWCLIIVLLSSIFYVTPRFSASKFSLSKVDHFSCWVIYTLSCCLLMLVFIKYQRLYASGLDLYTTDLSHLRLKILSYIFAVTTFLLYIRHKNFLLLVPLCVIFYLGIISGKRTEIFIAVSCILILLAFTQQRKYSIAGYGVVLFLLMSISLIIRLNLRVEDLRLFQSEFFVYTLLAEVFVVFSTLPHVIDNNFMITAPIDYLIQFWNSIIHIWIGPLRSLIITDFRSVGSIVSADIGMGFGLAQFILMESFFYFSWFGVLLVPFIVFFSFHFVYQLLLRINNPIFSAALLVLMPVFTRLVIREGIHNLSLYLYLCSAITLIIITISFIFKY